MQTVSVGRIASHRGSGLVAIIKLVSLHMGIAIDIAKIAPVGFHFIAPGVNGIHLSPSRFFPFGFRRQPFPNLLTVFIRLFPDHPFHGKVFSLVLCRIFPRDPLVLFLRHFVFVHVERVNPNLMHRGLVSIPFRLTTFGVFQALLVPDVGIRSRGEITRRDENHVLGQFCFFYVGRVWVR